MRAINHALTGAAIGLIVEEPLVAVPLALVSHYVLDVIPHYGANIAEEEDLNSTRFRALLFIDFCLCVVLVLVLASYRPRHWLLAAICAFVAAAPDLASLDRYLSVRRAKPFKPNRYIRFATGIQWFEKPIGAFVELFWFVALIILLVPLLHHK